MSLKKIISIAGKPGLFEIKSHSKNGIVVQSMLDNKRFSVNASQNVSVLNDIAIYTYDEEIPLRDILYTIFQKNDGKSVINHKEKNEKLISFFREVLPEFDEERVYTSNIKKVIQWYNILIANKFDFESLKETEEVKEE